MINNLLKNNKILMNEYDFKKNHQFDLDTLTIGSDKKIWWICSKGHEWQASIGSRVRTGCGCPYCSSRKALAGYNDLITMNPELLKEWNFTKNSISPYEIGENSSKKVWWMCSEGHEWQAIIYSRTIGNRCPYCNNKKIMKGYNDFSTTHPYLVKEWDYNKNSQLSPSEIFSGYNKKVWWICPKGHSYQQTPNNRISGHGCPICSKEKVTSFQEKIVYYYIKKYFPDATDNYKLKDYGKRELDIFIPSIKVGVEYDGGYYHTSIESDLEKDKLCESLGIKLYRIRDAKCLKMNSSSICFYRKDKTEKDLEKIITELLSNLNIENEKIDIKEDLYDIYSKIEFMEKEKSLAKTKPELLKEWNYEKNGNLTPESIAPSSSKKVWWMCPKGHEYETSILNKTKRNGTKCPICCNQKVLKGYNDLKTLNPDLAIEVDLFKNDGKTSEDFVVNSSKEIWWKCKICGFNWKARIIDRNKGRKKCPHCSKNNIKIC